MGASNVAKVFTHWTHLGNRDIRLLTYMALVSLDDNRPPRYFGGWEAAARAMGLDPAAKRNSAKEAFRQSAAQLVKAGAIVSSGNAKIGTRAEYAVTLDPDETFLACIEPHDSERDAVSWQPIKRANETLPLSMGEHQRDIAPQSNETLPQVGQWNVGDRGKETLPPRSTSGTTEGTPEEPTFSPEVTTSPGPVDNKSSENEAFQAFWDASPRQKVGRQPAFKAYNRREAS